MEIKVITSDQKGNQRKIWLNKNLIADLEVNKKNKIKESKESLLMVRKILLFKIKVDKISNQFYLQKSKLRLKKKAMIKLVLKERHKKSPKLTDILKKKPSMRNLNLEMEKQQHTGNKKRLMNKKNLSLWQGIMFQSQKKCLL